MSRRNKVPSYRLHKQSGQGIVTLADGYGGRRDILLGEYDTPVSRAKYARVVAEWETSNRRLHQNISPLSDLTVNELMLAYWRFAESYYVKDGEPTSEQDALRSALRYLKSLYGETPVRDFGPIALRAVIQAMIDHPITVDVKVNDPSAAHGRLEKKVIRQGLARKCINKHLGRIKRMFAWGVEAELIPASVHQALLRVPGLRKGKGKAREKAPVRAIPTAWIEAVLLHLPPVVRDMVQVQRLSGCRPQEVVQMRRADIDMSGAVWEYEPRRHKTEHHNDDDLVDRERIIYLGPQVQQILAPYVLLPVDTHFFSPQRSEAQRNERRRLERRTKLWPSHRRAQDRTGSKVGKRSFQDYYTVSAYRRAIYRGCMKARVPVWCPQQLRHTAGTAIRKRFGLEASQAVLGHRELGVTQVYAEVDRTTARRVMAKVG